MSPCWVTGLHVGKQNTRDLRTIFLAITTFIAVTACSAEISDPVRNFALNENMIGEIAVGNRNDACDYSEVLPQLLAQIGPEANIYPSENYYYFSFNHAGSLFSGSLRLSSDRRDDGEIDYVCYESYRSWIHADDGIHVQKHLSAVDGVMVEKLSALSYRVKYGGEQTRFFLHKLDHTRPGSPLLQNDIRVSRTQDESGAAFELIFNSKINDFYFLLDLQMSAPDGFIRSAPNTLISRRTGFVYYHNPARKRHVLVGVNRREALLNSYFDGPFDHLPENDYIEIGFWDFVYKAYPNMIGNHTPGGTIDADGMIFSIRPYRLYDQTSDLGFIESCIEKNQSEIDRIACMIWGF
ncbi:MAG: hypothetical protein COB49_11165 [Alphaproteobacteria bacterium]|nr:MAG: hypothetical protein COB49_11165 [Alphaproteobacteria bacterium]